MSITTKKASFTDEVPCLAATEIPRLLSLLESQEEVFLIGWNIARVLRGDFRVNAFSVSFSTYSGWEWRFHLQSTATKFNGRRWWYVCPSCNSRRSALYWTMINFGCRECLGLRYRIQYEYHENEFSRQCARIQRARLAIWGADEPDVTFLMRSSSSFKRPKGMRWKTFHRKLERLQEIEEGWYLVAIEHLNSWKSET